MSDKIEKFSKNVRRKIIETAYEAGSSSAHIGGALSSVEIVSTLFGELMNFNQINYQDQNRDRFILSKGHACLVYYCALSELGIISVEKLKTFEKPESAAVVAQYYRIDGNNMQSFIASFKFVV